ncbi:hypothetical protein CB0940_02464 [Cercospora beticola]|uniref:F-box domain-containing protein n=1 Tax=Cercospora beticola TaxID=122368 RepID=A0A2G5I2E9_CERBT|nr:hypothetical protein CB0940_02464 [Cercospora beticola]PIA98941.1 hypothetical protein CB0940_02464 [Cercospora beticola]WPA99599.1 hypothetical protein RHO25_004217 [Cercospora beticola]CAK1362260.1 unnamed protein product [Cercospora beticola]
MPTPSTNLRDICMSFGTRSRAATLNNPLPERLRKSNSGDMKDRNQAIIKSQTDLQVEAVQTTMSNVTLEPPSNKPQATGLNLPVELQLQVLSLLPARQIQCVRRVCKQLRDIIDLKENSSLVTSIQERERDRIASEFKHLFRETDDHRDFLNLLARFINHRGLAKRATDNFDTIKAFADYWAVLTTKADNHTIFGSKRKFAQHLAGCLVDLHISNHRADLYREHKYYGWTLAHGVYHHVPIASIISLFLSPSNFGSHYGITLQDLVDWIAAIISPTETIFNDMPAADEHLVGYDEAMGFSYEGGEDQDSCLTQQIIFRALRLPMAPKAVRENIGYHFRSNWKAYRMLESVKYGRLTELQKASLLEDVFPRVCQKGNSRAFWRYIAYF